MGQRLHFKMTKNLQIFFVILIAAICMPRLLPAETTQYFYYYNDQPIYLKPLHNQISLVFLQRAEQDALYSRLHRYVNGNVAEIRKIHHSSKHILKLQTPVSGQQLQKYMQTILTDGAIQMAAPVFRPQDVRWAVTDEFLVKFTPLTAIDDIEALNADRQVRIVKKINERTYVCSVSKQSGHNGLTMAQQYYALPETEWASPNFVYMNWELLNASVNDPLWEQQWAHKNTAQSVASGATDDFPQNVRGYADADMDVDEAWDELQQSGGSAGGSPDILIAIIDSGIDHEHPDLDDQFYSYGQDYSGDGHTDDVHGHGTNVAGIVSAEGNNGAGIAGIAYRSQLLPVKYYSKTGGASDEELAQAIDYAWQQGSDVLVNSWGGNAPNEALDDALNRAKTQGRNGLGCAIFFSSGNEARGRVNYPAYLSDVIAVGASNMYDEKKHTGSLENNFKWGANFGDALDLVAPSTVYTTDIVGSEGWADGDYMDHFGGTSASCPNAAGVAALMLAANPDLTADEVQEILQKSADNIEKYAYNASGWNKHVGYGRVNARNAVRMALNDDAQMPLIRHEMVQPTNSIEDRTITADISDDAGIAGGADEPKLYYRTVLSGDTSQWSSVGDTDGPIGNTYEFVIPGQKWGTQVQYYFAAQDNSSGSNVNTFPFGGSGPSPADIIAPNRLLKYYTGDFTSESYTSSDVPVSWTREYNDHFSTLNISDDRPIVDIDATVDVTGDDFVLNLESPQTRAVGLSGIQGDK
ncbi:MAG: S8 family serine peptidase, partial [Caldithrix sp.]|nr:S8 family serine peptidase [Caldithrix sp.]